MTELLDILPEQARERLRKRSQPKWTTPMLATLTHDPFADPDWIFERKLDGERCLVFRDADGLRLLSRNKKQLNNTYPELRDAAEQIGYKRFITDGEIVTFEGNLTSFKRLQQRIGIKNPKEARASAVKVFLYLFDLLHAGGYDLTNLPQRERKRLVRALPGLDEPLRYAPHRNEDGIKYLRDACDKGWEGLIAKRADAAYQHERSSDWLKFKCSHRQEFVIVGFTEPEGERIGFGSLLLAYYEEDALVYAGRVGTGFDDELLSDLRGRMEKITRHTCPLDNSPKSAAVRGATWIRPKLVGEVEFTEWTDDGRLRHPRFIGLRDDKDPKQVVRESKGR